MMTAKQFKAALTQLELSLNQAGPHLGLSRSQVFRYAAGTNPIPPTLELLLKAYLEHGLPD